jgi:hypothetical protein
MIRASLRVHAGLGRALTFNPVRVCLMAAALVFARG